MGNNYFKRDGRDLRFVLDELLDVGQLIEYEAYRDFSPEDFRMILDEARKIAEREIAPTFQDGDREGCLYENGKVFVPGSFHRLWQVFRDGSWFALHRPAAFGGQGLPLIISEAAQEFFMSANFAFACYSGMGAGNGAMIEEFGSEELKNTYLPKLYDGTWGACMCLTEPGVGSDAHMVTTRAKAAGDHYLIEGTKTFITSGEHDLVENIVHLVIARIEGAPPGAKGVSLFVVPKFRPHADGSLGEGNDVVCAGIEHKMGLHGSATCVMKYGENGDCRGWLVGEPGMGLAYMFKMVNIARMAVGLESVAFAANIYANLLEYARGRVQGVRYGSSDGQRVAIVEHPDVRRMLLTTKALTEGMRALVYTTYFYEELSHSAPQAETRRRAGLMLDFFTPIVKAYCSDRVFEIGRDGIQILGGYGFSCEYPIEQYVRDCKILSIWDGTNYIQSMDLIGRKLEQAEGYACDRWFAEIRELIVAESDNSELGAAVKVLNEALTAVASMRSAYAAMAAEPDDLLPLTATRFLDCCGELACAHLLLKEALIARKHLAKGCDPDTDDGRFYRGKIASAVFFALNILPNVFGRKRAFELADRTAALVTNELL